MGVFALCAIIFYMNFSYDDNLDDKTNVKNIISQGKNLNLHVDKRWANEILTDLKEADKKAEEAKHFTSD